MKPYFEELENRTRAMDLPEAPGWLVTVVCLVWAFAASITAFHMGA